MALLWWVHTVRVLFIYIYFLCHEGSNKHDPIYSAMKSAADLCGSNNR